jgi:hypothetical protein
MWRPLKSEGHDIAGYGDYYCDIIDCENKGAKVLALRDAGWLGARLHGGDRFDICWKHYIDTLQWFKQIAESQAKVSKDKPE